MSAGCDPCPTPAVCDAEYCSQADSLGSWHAAVDAMRERYSKPVRAQILEEGARLTVGDRDASYGEPSINLRCAMELKRVFDRYACAEDGTPRLGNAHHEAVHMALTKISRIAVGAYKRDNYVDGATYLAIAGEVGDAT